MPSLSRCLAVLHRVLTRVDSGHRRASRLILLLLLLLQLPLSAHAGRVALVIGNDRYEKMPSLRNPANDATDMAAKLQGLGFKLVGDKAHRNQTAAQMKLLIRTLGQTAKPGDEALFYFAGHGLGGDNDNYLIPVDDREIQAREDLPEFAISARSVLNRLEDRGSGVNVLILDACRNNNLPGKRDGARGLTRMAAPIGSFIAYAASEGETADDGNGRNGLFTGTLLSLMDQPGIRIDDLMGRVLEIVSAKVPGQQPMWEAKLTQPYYLKPAESAPGVGPVNSGSAPPAAVAASPAPVPASSTASSASTASASTNAPAASSALEEIAYKGRFFDVRVTGVRFQKGQRRGHTVVVSAELTSTSAKEIRLIPEGKNYSISAQTEIGELFGYHRSSGTNSVSVTDSYNGVLLQPGQSILITWQLHSSEAVQGQRLSMRSKFSVRDVESNKDSEAPIVLHNLRLPQESADTPNGLIPQQAEPVFGNRHFRVRITAVRALKGGREVVVAGDVTSTARGNIWLIPGGKNNSTSAQTELGEQFGTDRHSNGNDVSVTDSYYGVLLEPGQTTSLTWMLNSHDEVTGSRLSLTSNFFVKELDGRDRIETPISFSNLRLR